MRLLGYIRVSRDDQAQGGHSLGLVQPERLRAWCAANGHQLVDIVVDGEGEGETFRGVSGGLPLARRKGGADLLQRLAAGDADGVVVVSLTRLFRDVDDGRHFLRKVWRKAGVQLFSLAESVDVTSANGRLQLTILLALGEYERELTAERTTQVRDGLRKAGRVFGTTPYGCVAIDGHLFREPVQWAIREQIVAMRRVDGKSLQAISNELRRAHVTAPGGGIRWPKSTIATIVETHDSLAHLPHVADGSTCNTATPEAAVSSEPTHARHH